MEILEGIFSFAELVCEIAIYTPDLIEWITNPNKNSGL